MSKENIIYYCILDFEATCVENKTIINQEIIQFPSILYKYNIDTQELNRISEFNEYVKPVMNPILTEFCTKLTGITQNDVENANIFKIVLRNHYLWLKNFTQMENIIFITFGDWDLKTMLPNQLKINNNKAHKAYSRWINIKQVFKSVYKYNCSGMMDVLKYLKINHVGRHHNGYDDCLNISLIFEHLMLQNSKEFINHNVLYS